MVAALRRLGLPANLLILRPPACHQSLRHPGSGSICKLAGRGRFLSLVWSPRRFEARRWQFLLHRPNFRFPERPCLFRRCQAHSAQSQQALAVTALRLASKSQTGQRSDLAGFHGGGIAATPVSDVRWIGAFVVPGQPNHAGSKQFSPLSDDLDERFTGERVVHNFPVIDRQDASSFQRFENQQQLDTRTPPVQVLLGRDPGITCKQRTNADRSLGQGFTPVLSRRPANVARMQPASPP